MKRKLTIILALMMMLAVSICFASCGKDEAETEEQIRDEMTQEVEEGPAVVKTIDGIDEDIGKRPPLEISQIVLYEDGTVEIVPVDDLKKNEIKDEETTGIFPFKDSGKVSDIAVVEYGDEGYRTILALLDDGTISAVNGRALVEDHIIAVMDNVSGRDNFVSVENIEQDGEIFIVGYTEDGEEVVLDYSLNFK